MGHFVEIVQRVALAAAAAAVLSACQPAPAPPSVAAYDGIGYLVFNAPIVPQSRDLFVDDLNKLVDAGAREIHLALNSPGGETDAAQTMIDNMARLHAERGVTFKVYNIGMVASAASYLFLTAQHRYANARSAFLFHAAGLVSNGLVNAQRLHEAADKLDVYERTVRKTLTSRTRLTDAEAQTYVRRTVLLNADDARRDGVVDDIVEFALPKDAKAVVITVRRAPTPDTAAQPH